MARRADVAAVTVALCRVRGARHLDPLPLVPILGVARGIPSGRTGPRFHGASETSRGTATDGEG